MASPSDWVTTKPTIWRCSMIIASRSTKFQRSEFLDLMCPKVCGDRLAASIIPHVYRAHGGGGGITLDVRLPLGGEVSHWMYASHLGGGYHIGCTPPTWGGGVIPLDVRLPLGGGGVIPLDVRLPLGGG